MGMFDSVNVPCPACGAEVEFQSKSGPCMCDRYDLVTVPAEVVVGAAGIMACPCGCLIRLRATAIAVVERVGEWAHDISDKVS